MEPARKCPFCAEEVRPEAVKCWKCKSSIVPGTCLSCEKKNRREARFCGHCGSSDLISAGVPALVAEKIEKVAALPLELRCEQDGSLMILIPAGEFEMGSPEGVGKMGEHPQHKVHLGAFYMDKFAVTVAQYRKFCEAVGRSMRKQPSCNKDDHPVVNVDWDDANAYCRWAGKRLPTEAEWEKAARGGTDTKWHFGDDEGLLGEYAWYSANSGGMAHPVGGKRPNQYGLYDMAGNVWQWTADWYDANCYESGPARNPQGPSSGDYRAVRGGSWGDLADDTRAAYRYWSVPAGRYADQGFRCARQ